VSTRVVLVGGAQDGREFHVPDDDPIVRRGVVALPESGGLTPDPGAEQYTLLHYRWDGTEREDGARRYRVDP
jgi:hypothetical protein